ncbi:hypothetical protein M9H77_13092 [Catharanthus roseus]|uniref:Uncharacterized protein n=1 Tax=Catharanthus roseus TaxID=4058 RepID=A0ACC0BJF1_CATRO|nr:hypothetical protein M9H77_13092 [Catharanthus roseus]
MCFSFEGKQRGIGSVVDRVLSSWEPLHGRVQLQGAVTTPLNLSELRQDRVCPSGSSKILGGSAWAKTGGGEQYLLVICPRPFRLVIYEACILNCILCSWSSSM